MKCLQKKVNLALHPPPYVVKMCFMSHSITCLYGIVFHCIYVVMWN